MNSKSENSGSENSDATGHLVVARKYRPQAFSELIGQERVAEVLTNAITSSRVGHAYLFCGARGVGKTSAARIFAKALNCQSGPTPQPCGECDICKGVTSGEDVDVIEIDGASNRGIDEIRQLRSNVNVRPSRARDKIYIIDEVHMLTPQAFNALLKTLEEPPDHVKFIFCTTDPEKIPITVLSRCQRFDFASVETNSIQKRLKQICEEEGKEADDDALLLLARRAAGSMRDSQSLLEQLLAFCGDRLTSEHIHTLLGTASVGRLFEIADHISHRDAAKALTTFEKSRLEGVDAGQFAEQLITFYRDVMVVLVGGGAELFQLAADDESEQLSELAQSLGLEATLAIIQILDQTLSRLRQSTHGSTLVEFALVRICNLGDLQAMADAISNANHVVKVPDSKSSVAKAPAAKAASDDVAEKNQKKTKKNENKQLDDASISSKESEKTIDLTVELAGQYWEQMIGELGDMTASLVADHRQIAISAPNKLVVTLSSAYNRDECERNERKSRIESVLSKIANRQIRVDFRAQETVEAPKRKPPVSKRQLIRQAESHSFVQTAIELFDGEIEDVKTPIPNKPK